MGGVVRWATLREQWRDGVPSVVVGAISAVYLGPVALRLTEKWFGISVGHDGDPGALSGFLVGLFGMALTGFLIDVVRRYRGENDHA